MVSAVYVGMGHADVAGDDWFNLLEGHGLGRRWPDGWTEEGWELVETPLVDLIGGRRRRMRRQGGVSFKRHSTYLCTV